METFFPIPPEPVRQTEQEDSQNTQSPQQVPTAPEIGLTEIEFAIWSSSPEKAAGEDEITFAVWRRLWPKVKEWLLALYRASIRLQHLPQS